LNAFLVTILTAIVSPLLALWAKSRIDRRTATEEAERAAAQEKQEDEQADKKTIATLATHQVERVFHEMDKLRDVYREDLADLRRQLAESNKRVALLEREVAEWRSGIHGVAGVWVAVPAHIWEFVRANLPDLPATRFPGERDQLTERTEEDN
jgi:hypothetical protein